jgi:hypothetical protein
VETVPPLVDVEALCIAHLRADAGVAATLADPDGVATSLRRDFPPAGEGFIQLFRATATDAATGYLERAVIQVNSYGATSVEAFAVAAQAYRSLLEAASSSHASAVITNVARITGPTWSPDPTTDAPRYTASYAVTVHPA